MHRPRIRYARSGDLDIAFQVVGDGPVDIVFLPPFVHHLDLAWESPVWSMVWERLAGIGRVLLFDRRNTGLSDRTMAAPTLEDRMDDVLAVMDAAGSRRAAVVAYSEGGPLAMLLAATFPERVSALVLGSTWHRRDPPQDLDDQLKMVEEFWGTGTVLQYFDPTADAEWASRFERSAATPRVAVEVLRLNAMRDVSSAVSLIQAPTLVLHRDRDPIVWIDMARSLAREIPGAAYVELKGDTHLPRGITAWQDECDLIEEFLTGDRPVHEPERVLATVLMTDIADSTARLAEIGDVEWKHALLRHQTDAARLLQHYRGRLVRSTGDGLLATFDGPARAIRCARELVYRATRAGLAIRAGLHTGEIELMGDDIGGIAVHLAKRVESSAGAGSVWVSQTVRDLVTGSGIEFADRGQHELKGVPGEWRLYEVTST